METLFECRYTQSEKILKSFYQHVCFKNPIIILFYIVICASLIANISQLIIGQEAENSVFIVAPLVFVFQIIQYCRLVKIAIKRNNETSNGGETVITNLVTENSIIHSESNGYTNETMFESVKKVSKTKSLIIVQTKAKLAYIFPKDSFTKGSSEEFLLFLKSKGF